ncbi:hypothetical protein MMC28_010517 [Mycoblastus sanguinarius]|nr:hypothetical protein [Mycoblastus sanguinarius]
MACPLSAILNPIDDSSQVASSQATIVPTNDDASSEASTEVNDDNLRDFNTPVKHYRSSPNTDPSTDQSARRGILPPIVLSPNKSALYNREASTSPTRGPVLLSPPRRHLSISRAHDNRPSHETNVNRFSVFNALLNHPELTLEVAKHLDIEDLISLYAISKEFHILVNGRFTAMILAQALAKASESSRTFIFRCYKSLCMRDPARRPNDSHPDELRFIPSFRWLRMILFRESVVDDIMRCLAADGHRLPGRASLVIKKIWFTIDISDNPRRIGLLHNKNFWSNKDLFIATMFFFKLDMRLTHPTTGNGEIGLRKMLLGQRSLSMLARVLRREEMKTQLDMLRMIVRWNYQASGHENMSILGIPPQEVGKLQYEGWGFKNTKFVQIDELVMRESVRRKLSLQNHYVDMMLYGYINKKSFEDIRTPMLPSPQQVVDSDTEDSEDEHVMNKNTTRFSGSDTEDVEGEHADEVREEDEMAYDAYGLASVSKHRGRRADSVQG